MRLKEQGKLELDQKVFGTGSILGCDYATCDSGYDENELQITVRHLLEHSAGVGGNSNNDPVFSGNNNSLSPDDLIKKIIKERTPNAKPGKTYDYSNFGYSILGRIIEKLTNQSYESYVRDFILTPMNATDMFVGGNLSSRHPNEVAYYSNPKSRAYAFYYQHMDSFGGWITSPINLLKFTVQVDGFSSVPDFLQPGTITEMTTPSAVHSGYAFGWIISSTNSWWHNGGMPGTQTVFVRTSDEYTWAFFCNNGQQNPDVYSLMWNVKNRVNAWPSIDFFT
jgi:CubicO group peptidase (beta-lactamase class C family)